MTLLSPKKQEMREREQRILEIARPMVVRDGYHGLSMDRIAEELNYSKGTIYNHFPCKEEIILALSIQTIEKRVAMFQKAAQFKGNARFRMVAVSEAAEKFVREYPDYFMLEQMLKLQSVREKTSERRQMVNDNCEMQCMGLLGGIVRDAIANDQLELPKGISAEDLVFGLWSMSSGAYTIMFLSDSLHHLGLSEPFETVRRHCSALLDGYQWKPLSSEYDEPELRKRIRAEVFNHESP